MQKKLYIYYNFSRTEIEANNTLEFQELFLPENFSNQALRHLCDAVEFRFGGYQQEKIEPYVLPQIRRFMRQANAQLDNAFAYYSELDSSFLMLVANCHLDNLVVLDHASRAQVGVQYCPDELERFIESGGEAIARLGQRAGIGALAISRRQLRFNEYFAKRLCWRPNA